MNNEEPQWPKMPETEAHVCLRANSADICQLAMIGSPLVSRWKNAIAASAALGRAK